MNCPLCGEKMKEVEKCGIELDLCPGCKGVWLDRGELEKLMEYAAAHGPGAAAPLSPPSSPAEAARDYEHASRPPYRDSYRQYGHHDDDDDEHGYAHPREGHDDHHHGYEGRHGSYPRKKSWFSEVFDIFGD